MNAFFLEIVSQNSDFTFTGRDEVEDPLNGALAEAGAGEVAGGGGGLGRVRSTSRSRI